MLERKTRTEMLTLQWLEILAILWLGLISLNHRQECKPCWWGTWQEKFAGTNSFPGLMKVSGSKVVVRGFHGTPLSPILVRTHEHTHARKHTLWPNRQQTIHAEAKWMCEGRNCQCCCLEDRKSSRNISRKSRSENEWKWKVVSTLPSPSPVYERIKMVDEISLAYNDEEDVWNIWKNLLVRGRTQFSHKPPT